MKVFAATLEESGENSTILRVYSNESLTSQEAEQLTSSRNLIFSQNNPCYALTGKVSIQDAPNTEDQLKLDENTDILYKIAEAEVVPANVQMGYCPFQKAFVPRRFK